MNAPRVRDESGNYTRVLHPISCAISDSLQPLSTVNMVLPQMDEINSLDWVEVPVPDGSTMFCRVSSVSIDAVTGEKSVYLEHGACLFDDVLIPENAGRTSLSWNNNISTILTNIINKQPSGQPYRWKKGTVEATDTIYIEPGNMSLMTAVLTMMQSIPKYQVEFRQESKTNWYIDIKQRPAVVSCEGRLSRNLKTCSVDYNSDSVCTRVYCTGINNNGYMDSTKKEQDGSFTYGLHEETMTVDENLTQAQRQAIVRAYLDTHDHPAVSVSISAVELSQITGLSIDKFKKGTLCRLSIPWLNLTVNETIVEKSYSDVCGNPESVSISLANVAPDLSIAIASITGGGGGGGGGGKGKGGSEAQKKRYETKFEQTDQFFRLLATDTQWDELGNGTLTAYGQLTVTSSAIQGVVDDIANSQYSSITQMADSIRTEVTNRQNADEVLTSSINQTASQIALKVSKGDVATQLAVEAENVTISGTGDHALLVVEGMLTASDLDVYTGFIGEINTSSINCEGDASVMDTLTCSYLRVATGNISIGQGELYEPHSFTVDGVEQGKFLGDQDINFNIAATQTYKRGVTAVINSLTAERGSYTYTADVSVESTATHESNTKTLTIAADGWSASGRNIVRILDGNASLASVEIPMLAMEGSWTGATGTSAGTSNVYQVNEKDTDGTVIGSASGHRVNVYLVKGAQANNSVPIRIEAPNPNGTGNIIVAQDSVPVSGGGGQTIDGFSIGNVSADTTGTSAKLNVQVSALDAQGNVLKSDYISPVIPSSVYAPTLTSTNWYRSDGNGNNSSTGRFVTFKCKATTANGLGEDTGEYIRYIGTWLDAAETDGANTVTLDHQTWSDQSSPTANYSYTLRPGHNRKFQVNASNGQKMSCLMTAPSLTASDWTRTAFTRDTSTYNNGHSLSIPVSVTVGGVVFTNRFSTAALRVYRYNNAYVSVRFGSVEVGRYYIDSDD